MRQLTAPGGAIPAARFWTRSLSEYRGAPRLPRGATSVCGSRRATASPGRDERWGSRRATASPGRDERVWVEARHGFARARRALGVEARHGFAGARRALGGMGGHFGAPHLYRRKVACSVASSAGKKLSTRSSWSVMSWGVPRVVSVVKYRSTRSSLRNSIGKNGAGEA